MGSPVEALGFARADVPPLAWVGVIWHIGMRILGLTGANGNGDAPSGGHRRVCQCLVWHDYKCHVGFSAKGCLTNTQVE